MPTSTPSGHLGSLSETKGAQASPLECGHSTTATPANAGSGAVAPFPGIVGTRPSAQCLPHCVVGARTDFPELGTPPTGYQPKPGSGTSGFLAEAAHRLTACAARLFFAPERTGWRTHICEPIRCRYLLVVNRVKRLNRCHCLLLEDLDQGDARVRMIGHLCPTSLRSLIPQGRPIRTTWGRSAVR